MRVSESLFQSYKSNQIYFVPPFPRPKALKALKKGVFAGPDNVNPKLLKLAGNVIVPSLTRLYQHSLEDETVFSQWKSARVTHIHKGDEEIDPANYRPISLLSIPSKILESVVNDALVTHVFASNDLASDRQWAFGKGFSTELLLT